MSSFHLVNVWTDPEPGAGGFNPMATSMLWLPDDFRIGRAAPGFVFAHRWGGYPHEELPRQLGETLAARGCAFLSLCLRRRGMEGQLMALPDNDMRDVKLAIDYLQTNGCEDIFLIGQEVGAFSVLSYAAKHHDARVKGVAVIEQPDDLPDWLRKAVGEKAYAQALQEAGTAARQGAGMDYRIDLFPKHGPAVTQQAAAFLAWWSPMADTRVTHARETLGTPVLALTTNKPEACAKQLDAWSRELDARSFSGSDVEMVDVVADDRALFGLLWSPAETQKTAIAVLLVHGLTSSPTSPLFGKMGPALAQHGIAALAIETHRSGWAGHETALLDDDLHDIDRWIELLLERGFERIVLAGASMGSLSVGRYQSLRQHANVVALAHLMPTADCPDWFRAAAGDGPYEQAAAAAQTAVAEGKGDELLVDIDIRQPPPSLSGGRFRWTQRAASWLSWWGPDADSRNNHHIANARVPLLLLSGTTDSYNDPARFEQLRAAASQAPGVTEVWYDNVDHGLAGAERRTADDLYNWLKQIKAL